MKKKKFQKIELLICKRKKTGELFGVCCESAAIIKGDNYKKRKKLKDIGINIGLLFQIVDDLIDYKGDSKVAGKKTNKDRQKGKATLLKFLGYNKTVDFANNLKEKITSQIKGYGFNTKDLLDSVEFIMERKF